MNVIIKITNDKKHMFRSNDLEVQNALVTYYDTVATRVP